MVVVQVVWLCDICLCFSWQSYETVWAHVPFELVGKILYWIVKVKVCALMWWQGQEHILQHLKQVLPVKTKLLSTQFMASFQFVPVPVTAALLLCLWVTTLHLKWKESTFHRNAMKAALAGAEDLNSMILIIPHRGTCLTILHCAGLLSINTHLVTQWISA